MDRGIIETTINTCQALIDYAVIKCSGIIAGLSYIFFFGDTHYTVLFAIVVLTIMDMVTGIMASIQTGNSIESRKLFRTAIKLFVYVLMVSAGHLTESVIGINFYIDEIIMFVIACTELVSILENASRMGYAIPKKLLNQLKDFKSQK